MDPLLDGLLHTALLAQEKGLRFSLNGTNLLTIIDALILPCVPLSACYFSCLSASSLYITARAVSNTCTTAWILFHLESSTIKQIACSFELCFTKFSGHENAARFSTRIYHEWFRKNSGKSTSSYSEISWAWSPWSPEVPVKLYLLHSGVLALNSKIHILPTQQTNV